MGVILLISRRHDKAQMSVIYPEMLHRAQFPRSPAHIRATRSRRALPMTETELRLIAAAAMMGLNNNPIAGYSAPAAMGTPSTLYTNARTRFCRMLPMVARLKARPR